MNRTNGVPSGVLSCVLEDRFLCDPGSGPGSYQKETESVGGLFPFPRGVCFPAHFAISLPCRYLAAIDRPDRAAPAVKGRTGATPPFLPLVRHAGRGFVSGFVSPSTPPCGGSLPFKLSLREGSEQGSGHRPQVRRKTRRRQAP